jgi:hypothetical protein
MARFRNIEEFEAYCATVGAPRPIVGVGMILALIALFAVTR